MTIRILIADDHSGYDRAAHVSVIDPELEVIGEAGNGEEAVNMARRLRPDVVSWTCSCP
jgi:DNA-binding NarL/FixJ family response regulator